MFFPKYDIMPMSVNNNQISPNMVHATNMNATQSLLSIFKTPIPFDDNSGDEMIVPPPGIGKGAVRSVCS